MSNFLVVVCDNDNKRNVYQCACCGCQETAIVKRSTVQPTWKFAPVLETEFLVCLNCGAENKRGDAPKLLGPQNFPKRAQPWDTWICSCGKTSRKARVTYVYTQHVCSKCGKEGPKTFPQEAKFQPNKSHH